MRINAARTRRDLRTNSSWPACDALNRRLHDETIDADVPTITAARGQLPERVRRLLDRRTHAVQARRVAYRSWCDEAAQLVAERERWIEQHLSRQQDRGLDYGIDL